MHLRYCMYQAHKMNETRHPQMVMKDLGIDYQHATPQSIADQWWFWNCSNIPSNLPDFLTKLDLCPLSCIGYGLSEKQANDIKNR